MVKGGKEVAPDFYQRLLAIFGDRCVYHASLKDYTSAKVGGVTDYLVEAKTAEELTQAATLAAENKIPYLVLGLGTGVLVGDAGFPGLTIINKIDHVLFLPDHSQVIVGAGVTNGELVNVAANRGLGGAEFLAGVPGTIGGAVATGAAWGERTIYSILKEVVIFLPSQKEQPIITVNVKDLEADAFSSKIDFSQKYPPVILSAKLQLAQLAHEEILRRLQLVREKKPSTDSCLGWCFKSDVSEIVKKYRYRFPNVNGVRVDKNQPNIVRAGGNKFSAADYRQVIDGLWQLSHEEPEPLNQRVRYVGYWPEEEKDAA